MNTFSAGSAIRAGWEIFKKRPGIFVGAIVVVMIAGWVTGAASNAFGSHGIGYALGIVVNIVGNTLIGMGEAAFFLKAERTPEQAAVRDLWHPQQFLNYLGATILSFIIIVIGFVLLIVPGIIAALMLMFGCYFVIDRSLSPIAALKESRRITSGHKWELLLFVLAIVGINILGLLCLVVGLLVSVPVSMLATVHAYRTLSAQAGNAPSAA